MGGKRGSEPAADTRKESEIPLDVLPLHSTNLLTVLDENGIIQYESPSIERIYGNGQEDLVGTQVAEYFHPDDREDVVSTFQSVVTSEEYAVESIEYRHERADGSYTWVESVAAANPTPNGYYVVNTRDISDRKRREQKLTQFREAVEETAHAVFMTDSDGIIEYVNPAFETITGYTAETAIGETPNILHAGEKPETYFSKLWSTIRSGAVWEEEITNRRKDGERYIADQTIAPIVDENGETTAFVAVQTDITDRKEKETALDRSRKELRQVVDLVPDLIFAKNREGEYLLANEATAEAYGLTPEEVEGRKESDIIPSVDDSDDFRADDLEVIESGEPKKIPEEELTTADGETRILQTTKIPYRPPGSERDAVLGYARDVTELKEYEQVLERQRDNLEVLNQVVRHDIRNDLQLILSYTELLEKYVEEGGEKYLRQVLEAANEAVGITETAQEITEVLLQRDPERFRIGLRDVLENEIEEVRSLDENAQVTVEETIPAVSVVADDMLGSVFRNLLTNAVVHTDAEEPEITVSTTVAENVTRIHIADNGPGIPDSQKRQVFEEGEKGLHSGGSGLGLYLVKTLIDRYGGTVWVEDNDPCGCVFVVELPLADT